MVLLDSGAVRPRVVVVVCWSLTSLCHSNGHIETMSGREAFCIVMPAIFIKS